MSELKLNRTTSLTLSGQKTDIPAQKPVVRSTRNQRRAGGESVTPAKTITSVEDIITAMTSLEQEYRQQVVVIAQAFASLDSTENNRYRMPNLTPYWFALVFQTRSNKELFLRETDWLKIGDKYLCGEQVAPSLGLQMALPMGISPMVSAGKSVKLAGTNNLQVQANSLLVLQKEEDSISDEQQPEMSEEETPEYLQAFREARDKRIAGEVAWAYLINDTEYWFTLAFQSSEAKARFLVHTGWSADADVRYLCGEQVATHMGLVLPFDIPTFPSEDKLKQRFSALALSYP